jgi:hypothetical protein
MPSTYTTNLGIEKIASGDQSGTWGATTNTNFDILDQGINGIAQITLASAGTSGSPNSLPITNGAVSNGRNKFIEFVDGGDLGATAYVQLTPNDAEKIVFIRNSLSGSRSVIVFQGTYNASNDFEVANGKDVVLKFDGGGTGATVTQVFDDLLVSTLSTTTLNLGGTAVTSTAAELNVLDGVTATTAELNYVDGVTSNIQTQLDSKSSSTSPTFTGTVTIATADINGGNIDGTAIGSSSASTGNFSTLSIAGSAITSTAAEINILDGVTATASEINVLDGITATTTELNYVDGVTSAIQTQLNTKATIASPTFTGTVTIPTADINGGAIDGTAIGGTVASTGNFSTLSIGGSAITATAAELNVLDGITATTTELNYTDGVTSNIQTQLNAKAPLASPTLTGTTSISTLSLGGTTITATGTELNYTDGVTSNIQTQLNTKAPTASPTFTGTVTIPTLSLAGTTVTATGTELNYVDGVTSNIQTQLNTKASTASPTLTGTTSISTLSLGGTTITATAAELNILDGVTATTTELNYTDGVTSNIQTQLNAKAPTASPTFTGTVTIPTLSLAGTAVTATAAEINKLDGLTATTTELNYTDGVTSNIQTQLNAKAAKSFTVVTTNTTIAAGAQIITNSSSALTITLPSSPSAGDTVTISNENTGVVTVARNGSNITSLAENGTLNGGSSTQLVYVNSTIGWGEL